MKAATDDLLFVQWTSGEELKAGQDLYGAIPKHKRPLWAAAVLSYSIEVSGVDLPPVNHVLEIAQDDRRWEQAHNAFQAVRDLTLRAGPDGHSDIYIALVYVAELAAKVTFNASGSSAPFDADSGAWLAKNFHHLVTVCDAATEEEAWAVLSNPMWTSLES